MHPISEVVGQAYFNKRFFSKSYLSLRRIITTAANRAEKSFVLVLQNTHAAAKQCSLLLDIEDK